MTMEKWMSVVVGELRKGRFSSGNRLWWSTGEAGVGWMKQHSTAQPTSRINSTQPNSILNSTQFNSLVLCPDVALCSRAFGGLLGWWLAYSHALLSGPPLSREKPQIASDQPAPANRGFSSGRRQATAVRQKLAKAAAADRFDRS